jgi:hypothetical protein
MPLSDDQRAMLRLLAQREQGYDDLAALMGLSVEEVRARVKDALEAMEEGEAAAPLPPEPPTPAPEPPQPEEPPAPAPATPEPAAPKPSAPAAERSPSSRPRISMPSGQGARAAIAAGIAVVVLVIVVLAVSGDSGSDTSAGSSSSAGTTTTAAGTTAAGKQVTQAVLSPVDGSDASGAATFGRLKSSLALQVEAEGLAPTEKGQSYTIWLAASARKMLPLASTQTSKDGKIGAQFEVPTEVLAYLASETFDQIDVTLTTDSALKASLKKATSEKKAPAYTGTDVLRGTVTGPIVGAAKKKE